MLPAKLEAFLLAGLGTVLRKLFRGLFLGQLRGGTVDAFLLVGFEMALA